jgi:hypothetical protein
MKDPLFYDEVLFFPHTIPKLEGHPLWSLCGCVFNIFGLIFHVSQLPYCGLWLHGASNKTMLIQFHIWKEGNTFNCVPYRKRQYIPYILESNPHPFYSFRGLKNQVRIRIEWGLDSRSRAGFWKNDIASVCAVRTVQLFITLFIIY